MYLEIKKVLVVRKAPSPLPLRLYLVSLCISEASVSILNVKVHDFNVWAFNSFET